MSCIFEYKGQEFQTKKELLKYFADNKITSVDFKKEVSFRSTNKFTTVQQKQVTNTLAYVVLNHAKGDINNFTSLDFAEVVNDWLTKTAAKIPASSPMKARYQDVLSMSDFFVEEVKDFFASKGITVVEELNEDSDGNLFTENALLIDPKMSATARVRALLSLIPETTINKEGNAVLNKDTFLGTAKFVEENVMWNDIKVTLADIAEPTLEKMMSALVEDSGLKPHLGKLARIIDGKTKNPITGVVEFDENLRTQFFNAFALTRVDYISVLLEDTEEGIKVKVSNTDPSSQAKMLMDQWISNFNHDNTHLVGKYYYYDAGKITNILTEYVLLRKEVNSATQKISKFNVAADSTSKKELDALKENTIRVLRLAGIELTPTGLDYILRPFAKEKGSELAGLKAFLTRYSGVRGIMDSIADISKQLDNKKKVPMTVEEGNPLTNNSKRLLAIAGKQGEIIRNLAETNSLGAEGNLYSNYSVHSLLTQTINELNSDFAKASAEIDSDIYGSGSSIIEWMKQDPNNKLKYFVLNNYKTIGTGDQGSKIGDLSETDALVAALNITLNDSNTATHIGLAEADKARNIAVKGGKFLDAGVKFNPSEQALRKKYELLNDNASDALINYLADEMSRMRMIFENLYGENKLAPEERIMYLHDDANLLRSFLFPEFTKRNEKGQTIMHALGLVEEVTLEDGTVKEIPIQINKEDLRENRRLKQMVQTSFLSAVENDLLLLKDLGLITFENNAYKNVAIDSNVLGNRYKGNVVAAVADFTLNSIVGSVEMTKLFTGDPAQFKVKKETDLFGDFKKRIPLVIAGGTMSRVYTDKNTGEVAVKEYYNSATVGNVVAPSDYFTEKNSEGKIVVKEDLLDRMYEAVNGDPTAEGYKEQISREALKSMISNYSSVNTTDAQAWITLPFFKQRMLSQGKWSSAHEEAFNRLMEGGKFLPIDVKLFAQPLKTVHVEPVMVGGHRVRHYNKQSEAVIIPGLFPALDALVASNPEVDHFITLDGKKVGASGVVTINNGTELTPAKVNSVQLRTRYSYLQQDLPTKQVKNTLVGSQVVKNLLGNILKDGIYSIPNFKDMTGQEIIDLYHETISTLSDFEKENLFQEFGFDEATGVTNMDKFNDFLIRSLKDELTNAEKDLLDTGLSIDSMPHLREKLENKLMASILKSVVKLKQLGSANVQMSAFGTSDQDVSITDDVKNGIIWFKDPKEGLKPMQLEKDENGKLYTKKAQILIPHKTITKLLGPNYKTMTSKEISALIDPSVLTGISYRIPNQATSSNDSFEIVGILPPEMGDTIISYNEITTKTGSDFDIDKAFIVLPNVEFRDGKITRPRYAHEMSEEDAYQEKINKDWMNSVKGREIYAAIEEELFVEGSSYKQVKDKALANIKVIKGKLAAEQEIRDGLPTIDDDVDSFNIDDIVKILTDTLRQMSSNLAETGQMESSMSKLELADLKQNLRNEYETLNAVNDAIKEKVKARLTEQGVIKSFEEFQKMPTMMKYTKAALQNFRLDLMQALLGDVKTYPSAVATLDNPLLENEAKELYGKSNDDATNLHFFRGSTQTLTKVLFDQAKALVGNIANHMSDHNLSQAEEMTYTNTYFGRGERINGESVVSSIKDEKGNYVSTWLNLYMNAIVDAAKDPFIVQANINQYTSPVAFMLIRSGVDIKWVNAFIGQRSIKSLVKGKNIAESKIAKRKYDKSGRLITPETQLIEFYEKKTGLKFEELSNEAYERISKISTTDLKNNVKNPLKRNFEQEFVALAAFLQYKNVAKDLSAAIRASKADVAVGKNLLEAYIKELNLIKILQSKAIRNLHKKFGISSDPKVADFDADGYVNITEPRLSGTFHKNGIQTALKMWNGKTIMSSNAVKSLLFNIALENNPEIITNSRTLETLSREIYSYMAALPGSGITNGEIKDLFYGEKSLAREMYKFMQKNKDLVANNVLLQDLKINFRETSNAPDFLLFRNKNQDRELYQQAWKELSEVAPELADKLFKYAYHSSGFKKGSYSFYEYAPPQEYIKSGFNIFTDNLNVAASDPTFLSDAVDNIMSHLWYEKSIIKTASKVDIMSIDSKVSVGEAFFLRDRKTFDIGRNEADQVESARYLRSANNKLFKLVGYGLPNNTTLTAEQTRDKLPLYVRVNKKGYNKDGRIVKEYGISPETLSIFEENNVSLEDATVKALEAIELDNINPAVTEMQEAISTNITKAKRVYSKEEVEEAIKRCKGI